MNDPDEDLVFSDDEENADSIDLKNSLQEVRQSLRAVSEMSPKDDLLVLISFSEKIKQRHLKNYGTTNLQFLKDQAQKQSHLKQMKITKDNVSYELSENKVTPAPEENNNL